MRLIVLPGPHFGIVGLEAVISTEIDLTPIE